MASTSFQTRIIYKDSSDVWNLLLRAKSVPSPVGTPNTVESTTLEDDSQTFEMGIKTSDSMDITGNLEKKYFDKIKELEGKEIEVMFLYGTDGVGGVLQVARSGKVAVTPSDVGGVDEILEMTVTFVPTTVAEFVDKTIVDNGDGTFTVS